MIRKPSVDLFTPFLWLAIPVRVRRFALFYSQSSCRFPEFRPCLLTRSAVLSIALLRIRADIYGLLRSALDRKYALSVVRSGHPLAAELRTHSMTTGERSEALACSSRLARSSSASPSKYGHNHLSFSLPFPTPACAISPLSTESGNRVPI
ncbi:hypothetical protein M747DRAFT_310025 [Aspergillus niger ATCC 13496]|uniref:Uncharacterized protein n=1 Tax=Aspergillus niger ATCC 13496 TaxID=1353008 RepID=A0A370BPD3_ASPNG|nr:hypothetical protein M747DRAFT_310025 [Aspergillus niger ATCC 13496]